MTFDQIVADVMSRLNLSSKDAENRIGVRVNDRYRRIVSSIGLSTSKILIKGITVDPIVNTSLPDLTIEDMEKVIRIILVNSSNTQRVLEQLTYDDATKFHLVSRLPNAWAVKRMGASSCTITFDAFPATSTFDISVEGLEITDILADDAVPVFPVDFHDILIEGAMSDELRKMEKPDLASIAESNYERRLSDLRMFIAKSAYMDIYQGRNKPSYWYKNGFNRTFWN